MSLDPHLKHLFDRLEADRSGLMKEILPLSSDHFNRAAPGKWSLSQILSHLITAEKLSRQYMNKKVLGIREAENTGWSDELKMVLLKISQRLPFKFKAPKAVVESTPAYNDAMKLNADWLAEREELRKLLETFEDSQIRKKIYRHIRAGRLNVQHALIFFREHYIHHRPQIEKLLKK